MWGRRRHARRLLRPHMSFSTRRVSGMRTRRLPGHSGGDSDPGAPNGVAPASCSTAPGRPVAHRVESQAKPTEFAEPPGEARPAHRRHSAGIPVVIHSTDRMASKSSTAHPSSTRSTTTTVGRAGWPWGVRPPDAAARLPASPLSGPGSSNAHANVNMTGMRPTRGRRTSSTRSCSATAALATTMPTCSWRSYARSESPGSPREEGSSMQTIMTAAHSWKSCDPSSFPRHDNRSISGSIPRPATASGAAKIFASCHP